MIVRKGSRTISGWGRSSLRPASIRANRMSLPARGSSRPFGLDLLAEDDGVDAGDVSSGLGARHSLFRDDEIGKAGGHARHHFGGNRMGGPISSSAPCYPSEPFRG